MTLDMQPLFTQEYPLYRRSQDGNVDIDAVPWDMLIPDLGSWCTFKDLEDRVGQVEEEVKPDEQLNQEVSDASDRQCEYAEK
ncbi:hypothetical protein APSETT444_000799 [Aspergillus pseudonomiae]